MTHATYGYASKKDLVTKRLRRAEGQVRGIARMVEEDKYCIDILTQITAVQAALDKVALQLLSEHAKHCLRDPAIGPRNMDTKADELVGAVGRMLSR